jgi:hypothetical protein
LRHGDDVDGQSPFNRSRSRNGSGREFDRPQQREATPPRRGPGVGDNRPVDNRQEREFDPQRGVNEAPREFREPHRPTHQGMEPLRPPQRWYEGPFQSFQSEDDDDVFPPHSRLFPQPSRPPPTFPRHSSMKPGAQQTYLTGDEAGGEGPPGFDLNDISSVLDPPVDQSSTLPTAAPLPPPRRSWQPSQESSRSFPHPSSYSADVSEDALEPERGGVRGSGGRPGRPLARVWPSPKTHANDSSSDSSGRPLGYTRDHLHDVVDRLRTAPRSRSAPENRPGERYLDVSNQSPGGPIPSGSSGDLRGDSRSRGPSRGYPGYPRYPDDSTSSGLGSRNTSHSTGSLRPKGAPGTARPYGIGTNVSYPSSINNSSFPGNSNVNNGYRGNSLSSTLTPGSSSLLGDDAPLSPASNNVVPPRPASSIRRDTSADENYEFDHLPALESDILDDLQRYSRLAGSGKPAVNSGQLNQADTHHPDQSMMSELYPRPRKQSQYADAAERFERLREEFQQYRQQHETSPSYTGPFDTTGYQQQQQQQQPLYPMDSEML